MGVRSQTYDIFISYASTDTEVAAAVAAHLANEGFTVFVPHLMTSTVGFDSLVDTLWEALAESEALVAILSDESSGSSQGFEIGAASAWHKPIYVVSEVSSPRVPLMIHQYAVYPLSRLDDMARAIRAGRTPFTDDELGVLVRAYHVVGMPSDELSRAPDALNKLTQLFAKEAGRALSAEQLLREILRLRKSGKWPRLEKTSALTRMEQEVLRLMLKEQSVRQIAAQLHRSPRTIEVHRKNIRRKLGARTDLDLARYLARD